MVQHISPPCSWIATTQTGVLGPNPTSACSPASAYYTPQQEAGQVFEPLHLYWL